MNVFEYAMKMEEDGRDYYLEHAEKISNPALKRVLVELAEDELKHYNTFKALRDAQTTEYKESEKTTILSALKNVFETLKAETGEHSIPSDARSRE